jgi:DNA-binding response OmpR family regulator
MTKILVIEDDNLIRETLLEILESRNFEAVGMEKALELGADGYLNKPCSATEMLGAIANQLEKPKVTNPKYQKFQTNCDQPNLRLLLENCF